MTYLDTPEPRQRLHTEMQLIAANLTHLTKRYQVQPMGRTRLVIPTPTPTDLITGSAKDAVIPYKESVAACLLERTRLRVPGKTSATSQTVSTLESRAPWAWKSGISDASNTMTDWILLEEMRRPHTVTYKPEAAVLLTEFEERPLTSFINGILGEHCYPTEQHFVWDVCTYLSPWWRAEQEVDGVLDGDEVRIDAVLTLIDNDDIRIGVEFKNPHSLGNPLKGLVQASKYRHARWNNYGRLPIAFCCPGRVPTGSEVTFIGKQLKVGLLDFDGTWRIETPSLSWSETAGVTRYDTET